MSRQTREAGCNRSLTPEHERPLVKLVKGDCFGPDELDLLCYRQYAEASTSLLKRLDLRPLGRKERGQLPSCVVAISREFRKGTLQNDRYQNYPVIFGGPCVYHLNRGLADITLREVIDVVAPIALAARLNLDCVICLQLEDLQKLTGLGSENAPEIVEPLTFFRIFAERIATIYGLQQNKLFVINTLAYDVSAILDQQMDVMYQLVPDDLIYGLYDVRDRPSSPLPEPADLYGRLWRRSLTTYQPEFLSKALNRRITVVLAAENLDQAKAISLAGKLTRRRVAGTAIFHAAHISAPGLDGSLMMRSSSLRRLRVLDTDLVSKVEREPLIAAIYNHFWPVPIDDQVVKPLKLYHIVTLSQQLLFSTFGARRLACLR